MTSQDSSPERGTRYRRFQRAAEGPMLVLSVIFVVLLLIPEATGLEGGAVELGLVAIWGLFALEVAVLFVLAPRKGQMFREHWLDVVIVVVPFLRPLRVARIARLARAGGIVARTAEAVARITQRKGVQAYGALSAMAVTAGGLLVYAIERDQPDGTITSAADGLWWAIVTTTTVGYGDYAPVTPEGRAVAIVLMLLGVGLVGVVTANVAAYFVHEEQASELTDLREQLRRIEAKLDGRSSQPPRGG